MHNAEAAETVELIEATTEPEPVEEPAPPVEVPETAVGLVYQAGANAADLASLETTVAALSARMEGLREEMGHIARVAAETLLNEIIEEGESGEMQAEAEHQPASGKRWWEKALSGKA